MAAEKVGGIYYEVDADTAKLQKSAQDVDAALDKNQKSFATTDKAAAGAQRQMTATAKAVQQLGKEAQTAQNPLSSLGAAIAALVTAQGAMSLIRMAEGYGEMAERIRMATDSATEYENVQARLLATANATYRPLREAQELYILTADSLRSMGYNTNQAIDVVDSMSYSFVKNATSAERANNATSAFTGAIMTGKLEADAWKTVIAAIPTIIGDLAKSTGLGAAEIRKMGAEGKLTAQLLSEGLRQSLDENKAAADGMATTVKDAFTAASNALSVYIGEANLANGTTGLLSKSILLFADNLDTVVTLLTVLGAGALAKYITSTTLAAIASGRAAIAARVQAAEELRLASAHVAATTAAASNASANAGLSVSHAAAAAAATTQAAAELRLAAAKTAAQAAGVGLLGVLGGPAGIIALAASAAASIYLFGSNSANAAPSVDKLTESVDKLTAAQLENRKLQAQDAIDALKKKAQDAGGAVKGLEKDYEVLNAQMASGRGRVDSNGMENVKRALVEARAESDGATRSLQDAYDAYNKLAEAQATRTTGGPVNLTKTADPEVAKRLAQMREELELAKLTGESRARLQAIQKLGANASAQERAEAERLAAQIYNLETARKSSVKITNEQANKAVEYIKKLQEEAVGYKELTAVETLHYDLLAKKVVLNATQLAQAQKLAQDVDTRAQNERDLALAISTSNAALAAKARLEAEVAGYQADVSGVAMGERERAEMQKRLEIQSEYAKRSQDIEMQRIQALASAAPNEQARVQAQYDALLQIEQSYHQQSVAAYEQSLIDKRVAEGDWLNGVKAAFSDYAATSKNTAQLAATATKGAIDTVSSGIAGLIQGNKTSFADMTRSVLANLVQIAVQSAITKAAMAFFPGFSSGGAVAVPGFATGGYTGPGGTNQPAGVVHKGEVVWSKRDVAAAGGVAQVEAMRTGGVPNPVAGVASRAANASGGINITIAPVTPISITANGNDTESMQSNAADLGDMLKREMEEVARAVVVREQRPGGSIYALTNRRN